MRGGFVALLTTFLVACAGGCTEGRKTKGVDPAAAKRVAEAEPVRPNTTPSSDVASIHALEATTIDGEALALESFAGRVVLVVNVASQCGYTPQYEALEALARARGDDGLVVLGVPSNQFGGQEPGSNAEIKFFCETRYDVGFPLLAKTDVKGPDAHPLYRYLTTATGIEASWNFNKFLVGADGRAIAHFGSSTTPDSDALSAAVDRALAAR